MGSALGWAAVVAFVGVVIVDYRIRWNTRKR
jgi:hypothetical protein